MLSFEGHSLHWTKLVEIIEESNLIFLGGGEIFILFSKEIPTNLLKNEKS